jgi:hypothetical protein
MLRRSFLLAAIPACTLVCAQATDTATIVGTWGGDARLFDKALRARTGRVPAKLTFDTQLGLSGSIGGAGIPKTRPRSATPQRLEYAVRLEGQAMPETGIHRSHLVIIITTGAASTLDADFHLKSRFGLDPGMLVGHFDVAAIR